MSENSDDEGCVEFLEERNAGGTTSDLPHLRSQCMTHKFAELNYINKCENCYCYICDVAASACCNWTAHCEASNEGVKKDYWKKYKNDEMERRRIADGRPKKKLKTILSFFAKIENKADGEGAKVPILKDITNVDTTIERAAELKDQISP